MATIRMFEGGFQAIFSLSSAVFVLGMAAEELALEGSVSAVAAIEAGAAALLLAGARSVLLGRSQPLVFLVLAPLQVARGPGCVVGFSFALVAALLLLRMGWFCRRAAPKALGLGLLVVSGLVGFALIRGGGSVSWAQPLACSIVFCVTMRAFAKGRVPSILGPKSSVIDLARRGINQAERRSVMMRLGGESTKEISRREGLAESTVRSQLSEAYRKLGIRSAEELFSLSERFRLK